MRKGCPCRRAAGEGVLLEAGLWTTLMADGVDDVGGGRGLVSEGGTTEILCGFVRDG